MNNQTLPKPSQTKKVSEPKKNGVATPPPSAMNNASKPNSSMPNKQGVVFDGGGAKSRIPLSQKPVATPKSVSGQTPPINKSNDKTPASTTKTKLPPTSLSALSSMSSNTIPNTQTKKTIMPETTVLGKPIPQAIRGETLPKGLAPNVPSVSTTANSPISSSSVTQEKSTPVPIAPKSNPISKDKKTEKKITPEFATEKKSILKFLPFIVGGIAILAIVGFVASRLLGGGGKTTSLPRQNDSSAKSGNVPKNPTSETAKRTEVPSEQTELVYWGLWEPNEVINEIINDFELENPGIKITYIKQSHKDYRERLQTAFNEGKGPDIFRFHASWAPMLKSYLYPIPSSVISSKEFQDNYYPIVTDQLVAGGQYVGVPLMYDGLALYYNEDILESASETPPSTWSELRLLATKLTVRSANGIERAGLAIGNVENVDHFSDILAVLMLQNGANFNDPNSQETADAISFYTNFVSKDEVWNDKLPSSTIAFARGDVAMMFAPSWRAHEIAAQNPDLRFKTMTLPQLSENKITWGSYWAEGINSGSKNKDIAAKFVGFLSNDDNLMKLFSKASEIRSFGEIYPKISMADKLVDNDIVASYLDDATYAQSWYLNSFTHDNGINDQIISYYKDAIDAVLDGEDIEDVLLTIESGTKQVLKQYGISGK